jgi:hypothetical protein
LTQYNNPVQDETANDIKRQPNRNESPLNNRLETYEVNFKIDVYKLKEASKNISCLKDYIATDI